MHHASTLNTDVSLRGPFLAAHRALRKAVNARGAQVKGECSAAAWRLRQAGRESQSSEDVLRPLFVSQALSAALVDFGGPNLIPQHAGFVDYLRGQQQKVKVGRTMAAGDFNIIQEAHAPLGAEAPALPLNRISVLKAGAVVEGRREFAQLFEHHFQDLLALVDGRME